LEGCFAVKKAGYGKENIYQDIWLHFDSEIITEAKQSLSTLSGANGESMKVYLRTFGWSIPTL
jgi:hypothetical protein